MLKIVPESCPALLVDPYLPKFEVLVTFRRSAAIFNEESSSKYYEIEHYHNKPEVLAQERKDLQLTYMQYGSPGKF